MYGKGEYVLCRCDDCTGLRNLPYIDVILYIPPVTSQCKLGARSFGLLVSHGGVVLI